MPFKALKTHGMLTDPLTGEKLSKSSQVDGSFASPEDLIEGSAKLDGERKFGYGVDVLRAWVAYKDSDKTIGVDREQFDRINKEVKLIRDILRVLITQINQGAAHPSSAVEMGIVDKLFLISLLQYSKDIT